MPKKKTKVTNEELARMMVKGFEHVDERLKVMPTRDEMKEELRLTEARLGAKIEAISDDLKTSDELTSNQFADHGRRIRSLEKEVFPKTAR